MGLGTWIDFMLAGKKITAMFAGEILEGCVAREAFCRLCCGTWLWMNSQKDSVRMAVVHWGMLMTLLPSSKEYPENCLKASPGSCEYGTTVV
jgi:hypothetical protein